MGNVNKGLDIGVDTILQTNEVPAYGFDNVVTLAYEVRQLGRSSANIYENADTVALIALGKRCSMTELPCRKYHS